MVVRHWYSLLCTRGVVEEHYPRRGGAVLASTRLYSSLLRWHLALQEIKHARREILFVKSPQIRHHGVHRAF